MNTPRTPLPLPANLGKPGGPRFLDVLNFHLGNKIQTFVGRTLNVETMGEMYECVRETVDGVFSTSSQNLTSDSRMWLSQKLYECIKIGDSPIITRDEDTWKHGVRPVYERATLERAPINDVRLLAGLFDESAFAPEILDELRRRGER